MNKKRSIRTYPTFARNPIVEKSSEPYSIRFLPAMLNILPLLNNRALSVLSFALRNMQQNNGFVQIRREDVLTQYPNLAGNSYYAGLADLLEYNLLTRKTKRHNIFFVNPNYIKRINAQAIPYEHSSSNP